MPELETVFRDMSRVFITRLLGRALLRNKHRRSHQVRTDRHRQLRLCFRRKHCRN